MENKETFEILDMRNAEHPFDIIMEKANSLSVNEGFCVHKEHQITPLVNMIEALVFDVLEEAQDDGSFKTYFLKL